MNAESEIRAIASGVRAVAAVFALIVSYLNLRVAFQIGHFQNIFSDMLGDRPLPLLTQAVIQGRALLILLALLIPIGAVVSAAVLRNHKAALYTLAGLMLAAFVQMHLTWSALYAPLMAIINGLSGGG